jgi:type IX secretion system PorP/SprF family membrane protein
MKRNLLIIGIVLCGPALLAQLEPLSSQYLLNTLAINPAYAGNREALSITMLHRTQWTGFEGAPRTETLALHTPLRNERVGLGILAMNDRAGISSTRVFMGNFAYRIHAGDGIMSMGLGGGISILRKRWDELIAVDPEDELVPVSTENYLLPDFSIGIYYNSDRFFFGFSVPMFLSHDFNQASGSYDLVNDLAEYNYYFNGGVLLNLSSRWKVMPSVMIRYKQSSIPQMDINAHVIYHDRIWLGISYRSNNSLIGMITYQANNQLAVAYSYDMGLGSVGRYMGGSHEIMIRYDFRYIIDVINPRYF